MSAPQGHQVVFHDAEMSSEGSVNTPVVPGATMPVQPQAAQPVPAFPYADASHYAAPTIPVTPTHAIDPSSSIVCVWKRAFLRRLLAVALQL